MKRTRTACLILLSLGGGVSCSDLGLTLPDTMPWSNQVDSNVVYALGEREAFDSPLNRRLKPACPALSFKAQAFDLTRDHEHALAGVATEWAEAKVKLLVVGYAPPELPEDYARSLSERRAQAVRQKLIELGVEASDVQTAGFGSDFGPSGPNRDVVVIFREDARRRQADDEESDATPSLDPNLITVGL